VEGDRRRTLITGLRESLHGAAEAEHRRFVHLQQATPARTWDS
jgi:hypothetical protein